MDILGKQLVCLLACLVSFLSCNENEDGKNSIEENYDMIVKVEYSKWSEMYPDEGSKVYLYIGCNYLDFSGLKYDGEGIYYLGNKILKPNRTYIVDKNRIAIVNFEDCLNIEISMIVESKYSKLRGTKFFGKYDFSRKSSFLF